MSRHLIAIVAGACATAGLTACAEATRYRVLSFFFDGVPEPGSAPAGTSTADGLLTAPQGARRAPPVVYRHPPYRDGACRDCHDPGGRWVVRTVEEGLCQRCHPTIPGDDTFVHGPVASNGCLSCHHHHESAHPFMLIVAPAELCEHCHERSNLSTGPHHATLEQQPCLECHDPHGGDNRFLVKPVAKVDPPPSRPRRDNAPATYVAGSDYEPEAGAWTR